MWKNIKDFFQSKTVQIIAWVMIGLGSIVLIATGLATSKDVSGVITLIGVAVTAIGAVFIAIKKLIK